MPQKIHGFHPIPGTQLSIPYTVLEGAPGRTALVTAGIHSAEYVGIQALMELRNEFNPEELQGKVILLPLVNRSGFENRTMSMVWEDGKNLNRVFPGNPCGSVAERLAFSIMNHFIRCADLYIDLHCGDGYETLTPYVYFVGNTPAEEESRRLAEAVAVPCAVRSSCHSGGAYNVASVAGIPSVLIERGCMGRWSRDEVDADKADVINLLRAAGMIEGKPALYPKDFIFEEVVYEDAPATGLWYPDIQTGSRFHRGDRLGVICDYLGKKLHEVIAKTDGLMLYQTSSLNVLEKGPMVAYGVLPCGSKAKY